ncbi:hypothetical protein AAMO2058_000426400 [Amorphochlora amoebiformis]
MNRGGFSPGGEPYCRSSHHPILPSWRAIPRLLALTLAIFSLYFSPPPLSLSLQTQNRIHSITTPPQTSPASLAWSVNGKLPPGVGKVQWLRKAGVEVKGRKREEDDTPEIRPQWEERTRRLQDDLQPVLEEYNVILRQCATDGDWMGALKVFKDMKGVGIEADFDSYQGLLRALTKAGKTKQALKTLVIMKQKGYDIRLRSSDGKSPRNTQQTLSQRGQFQTQTPLAPIPTQPPPGFSTEKSDIWQATVASTSNSMSTSTSMPAGKRVSRQRASRSRKPPALPNTPRSVDISSLSTSVDISSLSTASSSMLSAALQEDLKPLLLEYNAQLQTLKKERNWREALRVFRQMVDLGIFADIATYTTLISVLGNARQCELMLKIHRLMKADKRITPDVRVYSTFISGLVRSGKIDWAVEAFEEMKKGGISPNIVTYSSIIAGLAGDRRWEMVGELMLEMKRNRIRPDQTFFNSIIASCAKTSQLDKALQYYALLRENNLRPTPYAFSSLIIACSRQNNPEMASRIFQEMRRSGVKGDVVVHNAYVAALGATGNVTGARVALEGMKKLRIRPDVYTFNSLVRAYERSGDLEGGFGILKEMQSYGVTPDLVTYNTLLMACVDQGDDGAAGDILSMIRRRKDIEPNSATYNLLIRIYTSSGQQRRAIGLVRYLQRSEPDGFVDKSLYNALILAVTASGYHRLALQIKEEMIQEEIEPDDVTYNTVINACATSGDTKNALATLEEMELMGLKPSIISYTSLMKAYRQRGDAANVLEIINRMESKNMTLDSTVFSVALSACAVKGNLRVAIQLVRKMEATGVMANEYIYNSFLGVCARAGKWQMALEGFRRMRRAGIDPNLATYDILIRMCNAAKQWARSVELFEQMRLSGIEPSEPILAELIKATENGDFVRPVKADQTNQALNLAVEGRVEESRQGVREKTPERSSEAERQEIAPESLGPIEPSIQQGDVSIDGAAPAGA